MFRVLLLVLLLGLLITQITATPFGFVAVAVLGVAITAGAIATIATIATSSIHYHRSLA